VIARLLLLALVAAAAACGPAPLVDARMPARGRPTRSVVKNKERAKCGYVLVSDGEYEPR
jgi:hypothetical protein